MYKKAYGTMDKDEKKDYARLLAHEINTDLKKIYRRMKPKNRLEPQKIRPEQIRLKHASLGATKMWEFRPNPREKAAKGDVGDVTVVTRGLKDNIVRRQRALLIAAEFYIYHAFANHPDPKQYKSIRCQNQYRDLLKKLFRMENAHDLRDQAVRYVIEQTGEHRTAHMSGKGWHTSIKKLRKHYPEIAETIGSSEKTYKDILRKQHQKYTPDMLKQEEDLIRKELEDTEHLINLLKEQEKKHDKELNRLVKIHIADLLTFKKVLQDIHKNLEQWELVDKQEHKELKKKHMTKDEMHRILKEEAAAEKTDINKVHIVFNHYKKEKINILRDLEMLDKISAEKRAKRGKT